MLYIYFFGQAYPLRNSCPVGNLYTYTSYGLVCLLILVDRNNKIFLPWELTSIFVQTLHILY